MTKTGLNLENNYILDFGKLLSWAKQGSLHKCPWFEIRAPSFRPHPITWELEVSNKGGVSSIRQNAG